MSDPVVARSADGMLHQFPAETPPAAIDKAMADYASQNAAQPQQPVSPPGGVQPAQQPQEPDVGMQGAFATGVAHGATFGAVPTHGADQHPIAAAAGQIVGSLLGGEAEMRLGGAALRAVGAGPALDAVGGFLAPRVSQAEAAAQAAAGQAVSKVQNSFRAVSNLLRLSGVGALAAGVQGATQGAVEGAQTGGVQGAATGAATGGAAGAATGAVAGPAFAGVVKAGQLSADALKGASVRALKLFADKLQMPVSQLQQLMTDFKSSTGYNASAADIIDAKSKADLAPVIQSKQEAHIGMQEAADKNTSALPGRVQRQLQALGSTQTPYPGEAPVATDDLTRLVNKRKELADAAMKPIETIPMQLDVRDAALLKDPDVRSVARNIPAAFSGDTTLSEKLGDAADKVTPPAAPNPGAVSNVVGLPAAKAGAPPMVNYASLVSRDDLTLRDIETLRRGLSEASSAAHAAGNSQAGVNLSNRADEISAIGRDRNQISAYGAMLDDWTEHSKFINGFEHGRNGGSPTLLTKAQQHLAPDLASPEGKLGLELGARTRMVDNAKTESGARGVINTARQPTAANPNLPVSEQNNQQAMAEAHTQSQENYRQLAGGQPKSKTQQTAEEARNIIEPAIAAAGHTTTGFMAHAYERLVLNYGVRASTAKALTQLLINRDDPAVIAGQINKLNVTQAQRRILLSNAARAIGRPIGSFVGDAAGAGQ